MSRKNEMDRVLSNPDNLIVSESLIGRIDFEDEPAPEISTKLTWGADCIPGRFVSYAIESEEDPEEEVKISFVCTEDNLNKLLMLKAGTRCKVEILTTVIEGCLFKIDVSALRSELSVRVFLNRYN